MFDQSKAKEYIPVPNPDFLHRKKIEEAIKNNDGYCCCSLEKTQATRCICREFGNQQKTGFCHCGRYYKILKAPKVYLCGGLRFKDKFFEVARDLTLKGYNVSVPLIFDENITEVQKHFIKELSKAKISDADIVFIINVDGYIGETTREEINWASELQKKIEYLEP